jgi:hypothetical protein
MQQGGDRWLRYFPGATAHRAASHSLCFSLACVSIASFRCASGRAWQRPCLQCLPNSSAIPSLGLLHAQFFMYWRGVGTIQYWRSFEQLHAYAHARNAAHLPAWAEFNRRIGGNGSVGIWHETYTVSQGQYEAIYANMPRFGLAAAAEHVPAIGRLDSARSRIGRSGEPGSVPDREPGPGQNL